MTEPLWASDETPSFLSLAAAAELSDSPPWAMLRDAGPQGTSADVVQQIDYTLPGSPTSGHAPDGEPWQWHLLPDGLMWRSYLAGPDEPRISSIMFFDTEGGIYWDATLGGRVGLLRFGDSGTFQPQGWQLDLEGAVMTRLNVLKSEDVESMDYRFGTQMTRAMGPWAAKFGYFHISSHAGDEYMERHPDFVRRNYVTESLILGGSYQAHEAFRVYGEVAHAFSRSGGARAWQFQTGVEYVPPIFDTRRGAPFTAVNMDFRQAVNYNLSMTAQTGWQWQGPRSGRRFRAGLQYHNGYSSQFQFYERKEEYIGYGLWFDY